MSTAINRVHLHDGEDRVLGILGIFEVFFRGTTGKSQKGSGVGLATVQKIAKMYEGRT